MATPIAKAPRKPRTRKPDPSTVDAIEAALTRLINPPVFVAGTGRTVDGVDYTVALYSDDSVRIARDDAPTAHGRFVATTRRDDYGYSVEARIVDVDPAAVPADIVDALSSDLTYFAFRAGRFAGGKGV